MFFTNLLRQIKQLEKNINDISIDAEKIENMHVTNTLFILKLVNEAKSDMDRIDYRGSFKTDDEVGFSFKALQTIIDTLSEQLDKLKK